MTRAEKINANPIFNETLIDMVAACNNSYDQAMNGKITFDEHVKMTNETRIKFIQRLLDEHIIV